MEHLYMSCVVSAAFVHTISAVILILQRKNGERSRLFLGIFTLCLGIDFFCRLLTFGEVGVDFQVLPVSLLLVGIFILLTYLIYPVEVISPGWVTYKRLFTSYGLVSLPLLIYLSRDRLGIDFTAYQDIRSLLSEMSRFENIFRLFLVLLIILPAVSLCKLPFTRKYSNIDCPWLVAYEILIMANVFGFLLVISFNNIALRSLYYVLSAFTTLYLTYQELFNRLIYKGELISLNDKNDNQGENCENETSDERLDAGQHHARQINKLYETLEKLMVEEEVWRDPNLTLSSLATIIGTNRTYLYEVIHNKTGYNFNEYINRKRIDCFIQFIRTHPDADITQAFYEVGYRSKSTAYRNFQLLMGTAPNKYFNQNQ